LNQFPIDWFSKKQNTVETATYGSEFVAARTATDQIVDLRNSLRYLGVPIRDKSHMFGDNESVVNSSMQPHARLHKRHTALSFHRVREAIAARYAAFHHLPGDLNPADILTKHWGYQQVWSTLQPLLFWRGDTMDLFQEKPVSDGDSTPPEEVGMEAGPKTAPQAAQSPSDTQLETQADATIEEATPDDSSIITKETGPSGTEPPKPHNTVGGSPTATPKEAETASSAKGNKGLRPNTNQEPKATQDETTVSSQKGSPNSWDTRLRSRSAAKRGVTRFSP